MVLAATLVPSSQATRLAAPRAKGRRRGRPRSFEAARLRRRVGGLRSEYGRDLRRRGKSYFPSGGLLGLSAGDSDAA